MKKNNLGFTLIEIIVSLSIFGIMMVSILTIFVISSDTSLKTDINRAMHENIKSVTFTISEDIRKNGIKGTSLLKIDNYSFSSDGKNKHGTSLFTNSGNAYFLAIKSGINYARVDDNSCEDIDKHCIIVKKQSGNDHPLTNSLVSVKKLDFYVSDVGSKKATINITVQPRLRVGVKTDLIKNSKLIMQTTISERPF